MLESKQEEGGSQNRQTLIVLRNQLKLIDAMKIAKSLLYSKQKIYEFGDKPGRHWVRFLDQRKAEDSGYMVT